MILKANLAACLLFGLAVVGSVAFGLGGPWRSLDDASWPLAFLSPVLIWSGGAWGLRRRRGDSILWLTTSVILMAIGLSAVCMDVSEIRHENPGEETMHLAAFAAMLLQWFVALALLLVVGAIRILARVFGGGKLSKSMVPGHPLEEGGRAAQAAPKS
jgi:hypothetical protein